MVIEFSSLTVCRGSVGSYLCDGFAAGWWISCSCLYSSCFGDSYSVWALTFFSVCVPASVSSTLNVILGFLFSASFKSRSALLSNFLFCFWLTSLLSTWLNILSKFYWLVSGELVPFPLTIGFSWPLPSFYESGDKSTSRLRSEWSEGSSYFF